MVTNPLFNTYQSVNEQSLYENLAIEMIQNHGHDVYYIIRTSGNRDELYGSDDGATYTKAYLIEMYVRSIEGFSGDGTLFSKFGLEIRDTIIFTVARRRFQNEIADIESLPRPREGDLVYFGANRKCFEIKFVEDKSVFYPLGSLFVYDLHCELFEYSSETFDTGIPEIDAISDYSLAVGDNGGNSAFDASDIDPLINNEVIQSEANTIIDFTEHDPFSDGSY